jgi:DNA polymerase III alpha subunit
VKSNQYGQVAVSEQEAFTALLERKIPNLEGVYLEDKNCIEQYNQARSVNADKIPRLNLLEELELSIEEFDKINQKEWFMPENYCPNLVEWLFEQCQNHQQNIRVNEELELFIQYDMMDLLHYIKYLVDTMRQHNIVWGVGRGSSVASYVLFLIGAHKVDSLKYNLDIREFLK